MKKIVVIILSSLFSLTMVAQEKKSKNKKVEFLAELFPNMKMSDVETLAAITTDKEIKEYAKDLGWDKKQIADIKL